MYQTAWNNTLAKYEEQSQAEHNEVEGLGGLYVIGSESKPFSRRSSSVRNSGLPPRIMSVPRPAIFVDTVTAPLRPARATIAASDSWFLTELDLREKGLDPLEDQDAYQTAWNNTLAKYEEQSQTDRTATHRDRPVDRNVLAADCRYGETRDVPSQ
jgi:hypothetical protein